MKPKDVLHILVAGLLAVSVAAVANAGETPGKHAVASPGFERVKGLAGEWVAASGEEAGKEVMAAYKVTANGSAVIETLFPGSPHEMVTVYYVDGKDLVLTHYCAAGNQPHMKAVRGGDDAKLVFKFAGGSNIRPTTDTHMHDAAIAFLEPDHIRSEWVLWEGGKKVDTKIFDLKRKQN